MTPESVVSLILSFRGWLLLIFFEEEQATKKININKEKILFIMIKSAHCFRSIAVHGLSKNFPVQTY